MATDTKYFPEVDWEKREWKVKPFSPAMRDADNIGRDVSAFTVAELGEMLPKEIWVKTKRNVKKKAWLHCIYETDGATWDIWYKTNTIDEDLEYLPLQSDSSEADARAKMLIYLIENKLIEI
jgi:hypothetical protein